MVQNLQLIQNFKKTTVEHSPHGERLNFWMDIIVEATQGTTNRLRFPVRTHIGYANKHTRSDHIQRLVLTCLLSLCVTGVDSGAN